MHLLDSGGTELAGDLGCEIDLVVRRPNRRTQLRNEIAGARGEMLVHLLDCPRHNRQLSAFAARMDQTKNAPDRIDQENRAAIRNVNA
jgi:hypothetical protein